MTLKHNKCLRANSQCTDPNTEKHKHPVTHRFPPSHMLTHTSCLCKHCRSHQYCIISIKVHISTWMGIKTDAVLSTCSLLSISSIHKLKALPKLPPFLPVFVRCWDESDKDEGGKKAKAIPVRLEEGKPQWGERASQVFVLLWRGCARFNYAFLRFCLSPTAPSWTTRGRKKHVR